MEFANCFSESVWEVGLEGWSYAALSGGWAGPEGSIVAEQTVGWMSLELGGASLSS